MGSNIIRVAIATVGAGAMLAVGAGTAAAWPIPITAEQQNFISQARGALMAGQQACRALYINQGVQGAIDAIAGPNGATPDQAAGLVRAARATLCTQAPG